MLVYTMARESKVCLTMAGSERTERKEEWGGLKPERKPLSNELLAQVLWLLINTDIYNFQLFKAQLLIKYTTL